MPRQRMGKRTEMRKTETRRERGALRGRETRDRGGEEPGGRERPGVVEGGDTNPRRQGQPEGRGDIEAQRQRRETRRPRGGKPGDREPAAERDQGEASVTRQVRTHRPPARGQGQEGA